MDGELVHIGFGNILVMDKVVAIAAPGSAPIKRAVQDAKTTGKLIDMTSGRRTKAVIFTESSHIVLAALAPETITGRLQVMRGGTVIKPETAAVEKGRK